MLPGNNSTEPYDWRKWMPTSNASSDWSQYASGANGSPRAMLSSIGGQEIHWDDLAPGNFSGDASNATTVDELKIWRERAQIGIHNFVPKPFQNRSEASVEREYHANLDRITAAANATTEAPAAAVAEVAPTEAPSLAIAASAVSVTVTEAPAAVPGAPTAPTVAPTVGAGTTTTTWWLLVDEAEVQKVQPAVSPLRQASPMLVMFALLAGAAVLAVGRRRHVGVGSEPLLQTEYEVLP